VTVIEFIGGNIKPRRFVMLRARPRLASPRREGPQNPTPGLRKLPRFAAGRGATVRRVQPLLPRRPPPRAARTHTPQRQRA
jgi:hypothetical protein